MSLGSFLGGAAQGFNQQQQLFQQQQQIQRQNALQNLQLTQQMVPGLTFNDPAAAAALVNNTNATLRAAGFAAPNQAIVGGTKTVETPLAPGQMGPGLPQTVPDFDNATTRKAIWANAGLGPMRPQVLQIKPGTTMMMVGPDGTVTQGGTAPYVMNPYQAARLQEMASAQAALGQYRLGEMGIRQGLLSLAANRAGRSGGRSQQGDYTPMPTADGSIVLINRRTGQVTPTPYKAPPRGGAASNIFGGAVGAQPSQPAAPAPTTPPSLAPYVTPPLLPSARPSLAPTRANAASVQAERAQAANYLKGKGY